MTPKPKFKIGKDAFCWQVVRGHWSPKNKAYRWAPESYHPSLPSALRFLHDRLVREQYEPKGLEGLVEQVEEVYDRLQAYAEELMKDPDAELET